MPTSPVRASSDYPSSIEGDTEVSSATKQKGSDAGANPIPPNVAYRDEIFKAATKHHVDPMWLAAQAAQETGGPTSNSGRNVQQIGGHGHGLFQIDSGAYAPWLKGHHTGMDVQENADFAASIDAHNLREYGSMSAAMTVFNVGHDDPAASAVTTWPDGRRLHYAESVERHLEALRDLAAKIR